MIKMNEIEEKLPQFFVASSNKARTEVLIFSLSLNISDKVLVPNIFLSVAAANNRVDLL
jgi:hypothetical protein